MTIADAKTLPYRMAPITDFAPRPGRLVEWVVAGDVAAMTAAALPHPAPPSYAQYNHIARYQTCRDANDSEASWMAAVFDLPGELDVAAMTLALEKWVRRHPALLSWFSPDGESPQRYVISPEVFGLRPQILGDFGEPVEIRDLLRRQFNTRLSPLAWPPFIVGAIKREDSATMYFAVDHLQSDTYSLTQMFHELRTLYAAETTGSADILPDTGSHVDYCALEVATAAQVTDASPGVARWLEFAEACGGRPPKFPLDLGLPPGEQALGAPYCIELLNATEAEEFDAACSAARVRFTAGLLAVLGIAQRQVAGLDHFRKLMAVHTRAERRWADAHGWFVNLVPVEFLVPEDLRFSTIAQNAQLALLKAVQLSDIPFLRVAQILSNRVDLAGDPRSTVPMISYFDFRQAPASRDLEKANFQVYGDNAVFDEAVMWVSRDWGRVTLGVVYPDTQVARENVQLYTQQVLGVIKQIARTGEFHRDASSITEEL